jgi:peptidoglycan/xylan/chitin deacetylase (PgdA/CDA1 family)
MHPHFQSALRLRRRHLFAVAFMVWLVLVVPARAGAAPTVVSLTFDDGTATEYQARSLLSSHGMLGTFYINSSKLGTDSYYMTWAQVDDLAADGNEIGGHTSLHVDLTQTDPTEAKRQVCNDRVNLLNRGYAVRSFAYPFGASDASAKAIVQSCGYNSARTTSQYVPPPAESIPPQDPYAIRVAGAAAASVTLSTLESYVTRVEQNGGGWAPLVFHQICDGCDANSISKADFAAFLDWLQPRAANGTVVNTVGDVIGGAVQPAVAGPAAPAAPNGSNALRNASLEQDSNANKAPDCWDFDNWGTNSYLWTRTTDAHTGSFAERVDVSNYSAGDAKLIVTRDEGFCTPSVTPGHKYRVTAWYKSSAPVSFVASTRDSLGAFYYWVTSPSFPASSSWTQASWVTSTVPSGVNGVSFGLALASNGSLTVDDLGLDDAAATGGADTTAPTVALTAPAAGSRMAGTVTLSADASDNVAVDHVDFLVDGNVAGTLSSGPFNFNWNSRAVTNGTHTITARAVDTAGNSKTSSAVSVTIANSSTNLLQNPSLETASGSTPTCWLLGGYGTSTFAWTRTSDAHAGNFAERLDVTSYSSGDRKFLSAQDAGTCAVSATPGHTYTFDGWYKTVNDPNLLGTQPIVFAFYRNSSGAWVYWAQTARLPTATSWAEAFWTTPAVPAGATAISLGFGLNNTGSLTMDDFTVIDNTPPPDTTPPTSSITCNGASDAGGCSPGYYGGTVQVALSAADDLSGSGVKEIRYTTDGSDPTASNGNVYVGPFGVGSTTTVKYRAFDNAGNAESVHSQLIRIDTTAPSTTIGCDGVDCAGGFYNQGISVSLSSTDVGGAGVAQIRYTTDGSDPTASTGNEYLGEFSLSSTATVKYRAFDNAGNAEQVESQLIQIDTVPPTTRIYCNSLPCMSTAYSSPVSVSLDATDDSGGSGVADVIYTTDGSDPTETNGNVWNTGFPFTVSTTATVKYRALDLAGNAEPVNTRIIRVSTPTTVTLTSPTSGATVSGIATLSATVSDTPPDHVDFLVDGQIVGTSAADPYTTDWDSSTVADGQHTITARAVDVAGATIASDSASVTVANQGADTTPPSSAISCNGDVCSTGWYRAAVSVTLSATDAESGVKEIRFTTDGSDPTATNGRVYTGSFSVASTTSVKYRAFDNAGNAELINSRLVQIDTVAPTSSIACQDVACASGYYTSSVRIHLAATDNISGSGVATIRYTTDGSTPTASNGSDFTADVTLTATTTVKYRAFDAAGNAEAVNSALVRVDTTPPSTTINCNSTPCTSGYYQANVSVSLSATDADSGVASIRYTTNGTDPTSTTGTLYSAAFTLASTTTVKYRAFDRAGNAEAVNSALVKIDATAPTVSLTSPTSGAAVAGTTTLQASASDNVAVDHVDFLVDGTRVGTASSAPYTYSWDSTTVADGTHAVAARAVDGAGNTTTSSSASVSVRNVNLLRNPSLETASGSTPTCWTLGGYGNNTFTWTRTSDAHTGSFGESLSVNTYTDGDRKLVSTQDTGTCAPAVTAGRSYTVTAYYKSPGQPIIFAYYRNSSGAWVYWAQSPRLAIAAAWTQASWSTPAAPAGATAVSIGLGLNTAASVTMDDFGLFSNG